STRAKAAIAPKVAIIFSFGEEAGWEPALPLVAVGREMSTSKEMQEASQPKAEAAEPTSVTGTRSASPRKRAASVAAPMIRMALCGVWKRGGMRANGVGMEPLRLKAKTMRVEAAKLPLKHWKRPNMAI